MELIVLTVLGIVLPFVYGCLQLGRSRAAFGIVSFSTPRFLPNPVCVCVNSDGTMKLNFASFGSTF